MDHRLIWETAYSFDVSLILVPCVLYCSTNCSYIFFWLYERIFLYKLYYPQVSKYLLFARALFAQVNMFHRIRFCTLFISIFYLHSKSASLTLVNCGLSLRISIFVVDLHWPSFVILMQISSVFVLNCVGRLNKKIRKIILVIFRARAGDFLALEGDGTQYIYLD